MSSKKHKKVAKKSNTTSSQQLRHYIQVVVAVCLGSLLLGLKVEVTNSSSRSASQVQTTETEKLPPLPVAKNYLIEPTLTARNGIVIDVDSGTILWSKAPDEPGLPASTTKMMTALVALQVYQLDQVVTITEEDRSIGNTMKLIRGDQLTVKDLLAGLVVSSGNDAALALARAYPDRGYSGFVAKMNQTAKELGLENTQFKNVSGVESYGHYASAHDLAKLIMVASKHPEFERLIRTKQITVTSQLGNEYQLTNTNQLLGEIVGMIGGKTGWTENAGECLVTLIERDGRTVAVALLGSEDRFGETTTLIDWVYQSYSWVAPQEITFAQ